MIKDINDVEIEVGDLVLKPNHSSFHKHYVLGQTSKGSLILSCKRSNKKPVYKSVTNGWRKDVDRYIEKEGVGAIEYKGYSDVSIHNSKQYLQWIPELLVIKKNCDIPEKLRKFIK